MILQCPNCKADIDDDSFHCDQCGVELMKCGRCGFFGKGKFCPHDRAPLMSAKVLASGTAMASTKSAPASVAGTAPMGGATPQAPVTPPPSPASPAPVATASVPAGPAKILCLRSAANSVELRPASGDLLGRRNGPHAGLLGRFSQISSSHLEVRRDAGGHWYVKDLNSFNHSFYNGVKLTPQQEQQLHPGATLSLADVAFSVSFE